MGHKNTKTKNPEFDIKKAKILVNKCLSKDKLYYKYLDYIMKLDDKSFENLIKGKKEITFNNNNEYQFSKLVAKFNDYSKIIYSWHNDKKKYEGITLLWENDVCIFELYGLKVDEFLNKLDIYNIPKDFQVELKSFLDNTIEGKSSNILENIKNNLSEAYEILDFALNEEKVFAEKKKNDNYHENISKIIAGIILSSFPIIKSYLRTIENLDPLSKSEINEGIFTKLGKLIKKEIENQKNTKTTCHQKLIDLSKKFESGKLLEKFIGKVKGFYGNPMVCYCHLALSFLNLLYSIYEFEKFSNQFKKDNKNISREYSKIFHDFETHKNELGILDTSDITNINLSIDKIKEIKEKILIDKMRIMDLNNRVKEAINKAKSQKIKSGFSIAMSCLGLISSIIGAVVTGGVSCIIYVAGVALNATSLSLNSYAVHQINKQLDIYNIMLDEGIKKYKEIEQLLNAIENKYRNIV
jgi:hypothetical protein